MIWLVIVLYLLAMALALFMLSAIMKIRILDMVASSFMQETKDYAEATAKILGGLENRCTDFQSRLEYLEVKAVDFEENIEELKQDKNGY